MNGIDLLTLICLGGFLILGIYRGLLRSVASLTALLLGLAFAKRYAPLAADFLTTLGLPDRHDVLGYCAIFMVFYLAVRILFVLIRKLSRATGLSAIDRALGGLMGLTKGALIAVAIITIMQLTLPKDSVIIRESQAVPYANRIIAYAGSLVPASIHAQLKGA